MNDNEMRDKRLMELEAELTMQQKDLEMREKELEEREQTIDVRKRSRECSPGHGVLYPTTKKTSSKSTNWDGHAVITCGACGQNSKFQLGCWDNAGQRDLNLRPWKPRP